MSFVRRVVTNFRLSFSASRKLRRDLEKLSLEVAGVRSEVSELRGGSAHSPGINLDSPLVWLMVTQATDVGAAGRRLNIVRWGSLTYPAYAESSKYELDEDDEQVYLIETDATMPCIFLGARVLCVNTRLYGQGDEPAKGLYRPIAGELFGFYARLGDRNEFGTYPWTQVSPLPEEIPHPDLYTDESDPLGLGVLGPAVPFDSLAYDPSVLQRFDFSGGKVFMFTNRGLNPGFRFIGGEEPLHGPCEEVVAA
ncbi:MAG: hypothetical protein IT450_11415 [Phycisphaerales bacterium]|nr:hypothetical protein [Phycisphaerales bacterium]